MVLFHGLEGYGLNILDSGSQGTFQVRGQSETDSGFLLCEGGAPTALRNMGHKHLGLPVDEYCPA